MTKNRFWLSAYIAICACVSAPAEVPNSPDYGQDVQILRAGLTTLYPSLNRFGQEADVLAALDRLEIMAKAGAEPLEFYRAVAQVAVATKDEHVIPFPADSYRQSRRTGQMMLPYTVQWVGKKPYLSATADQRLTAYIGKPITAFDGVAAETVYDTLSKTIPSDGLSETFAKRRLEDFAPTQNENYFDLNYPIWFGARTSYSLEFDGVSGSISAEALTWTDFSNFYEQRFQRTEPIEFLWLDSDTAYLSVSSFHDWYYAQHKTDAARRLKEIFGAVSERADARLILDLRRNEGGGDISSLLLDYLMPSPFREYDQVLTSFVGQPQAAVYCKNADEVVFSPEWSEMTNDGNFQLRAEFNALITGAGERAPKENRFKGDLIVLISGATGSAAAKVAAVLDRADRAMFVGEETGGAAAGATAFGYCSLELPASGISVDIPLIRFERETDHPYGRGVLPDVHVDAGLVPPAFEKDKALSVAMGSLD